MIHDGYRRKAQKDVPLTALKTEKGGHKPRSTGESLEDEKHKQTDDPLWLSKTHAFLTTP